MMTCTRCESTGFLNLHQIDDEDILSNMVTEDILEWIVEHPDHDVMVCDCCGDGEGWYGEPGEHRHDGANWDTPNVPDCI